MRLFTKALLLLLAGACILLARQADSRQDAAGQAPHQAAAVISR